MSNNIDDVFAAIEAMIMPDLTDNTRIIGKKMAVDVLDVMSAEMLERCEDRRVDPTGTPWADNSDSYKKSKRKAGKPVGELEHKMLTREQFDGTREFTTTMALSEYGISDFERKKAQWFTRGSESNQPGDIEASGANGYQPPRPFYELDDDIRDKAGAVIDQAVTDLVSTFNHGVP